MWTGVSVLFALGSASNISKVILMWPFKRKAQDLSDVHVRSWNLMHFATDPDRNWNFANNFRKTEIPGSVLTCETTFIMGSLARGIIRERVNPSLVETCIASAEKAFHQSFEEDSKTSMPEEMQEIYGSQRFNAVASNALMQYAEDDDQLYLTVSRFVSRIKGDPRMMYEVLPLFEERRKMLINAFGE